MAEKDVVDDLKEWGGGIPPGDAFMRMAAANEITRLRVETARLHDEVSDSVPRELLERWLNEVGREADERGFAFVYSEGWKNACMAVLIKLDDWRRLRGSASVS